MIAPAKIARLALAVAIVAAAADFARPVLAAELRCLTRAEQRARTATHAVVPLSKAMRAAKAKRGEVVRASLCERDGQLVYRLTLLRGGTVASTMVDARNGAVVAER